MKDITKASQLIVLGNGFDLHCGLKSSYKDFLYYVITQKYAKYFPSDSEESSEKVFGYFKEYLKVREEKFGKLYFENINLNISPQIFPDINIWYLILFHERTRQSSNWSDIESVIEKYVSSKFIFNKDKEKQFQKTFIDILVDVFFNYGFGVNIISEDMMKQSEYNFAGLLLYHILKRESGCYRIETKVNELKSAYNNYKSRSIWLGTDAAKEREFVFDLKKSQRSKVEELIINLLMSELHNLEKDFQTYLIQEIKNGEYKSKAEEFLQTIVMDGGVPSRHSVFSFNYTNSCSGKPGIQVAFRNVHGALNHTSDESKIIFGIDNISSDSRSEDIGYRFTKSYRTMRLYTELENDKTFGDKIDNIFTKDMDIIKFYGHSLARADYSYFQYIFDMYDLYNSNIKLIFYYSEIEGRTVEEVRQEQYRNITKLIEQYGETLDNKAHGRNLLTRLIQTGRLKIKEIGD